jgi:NAD-reducing hydrogenase small subunit
VRSMREERWKIPGYFSGLPSHVDIAPVEGSVSNEDDEHKIKLVRSRVQTLISLGDWAVTGNVPAMRNHFSVDSLFDRAYLENAALQQQRPTTRVPALLVPVRPIHEVVPVDICVPGCPPSADTIYTILTELLAGRVPDITVALWSSGKDHGKNDHN